MDPTVQEAIVQTQDEGVTIVTKQFLQQLISNNSSRIGFADKESHRGNLKSSAWDKFKIILLDKKQVDFARCSKCQEILSWKSHSTSAFLRHVCQSASKSSVQLSLQQFAKRAFPESSKAELNKQLTIGLALDLKPLGSVDSKGFRLIAQQLINFGARFGFQDVSNVLQHSTTLKRKLPDIVGEKKLSMIEELKSMPTFPKFAFTTDMWSDKYQQRRFISLTVHYVDNAFAVTSKMMGVEEFPHAPKSTPNIRKECERIIEGYFGNNTVKVINSSVAVTDGGSNIIGAFPNRLPCLCHRLNSTITIFNEKTPKRNFNAKNTFHFLTECPTAITSIKNVVAYFKRSGLNSKLAYSLKQDVSTRWNSELIMLQSYLKSKVEVKKILLETNQLEKIMAIDDNSVEAIIQFLQPFYECTKIWSQEKVPTIHEVVLWVRKIQEHVAIKDSDSGYLLKLKNHAQVCVAEYFDLDNIYYIACMFHPRYKKLKFTDESTRKRVYEKLSDMIKECSTLSSITSQSSNSELGVSNKRSKFAEFEDSSDSESEHEIGELTKYLQHRFAWESNDEFDIIKFWKNARSEFPVISKIAMWIIAIPASQTSDERVFSTTGSTLTPRRTSLGGSTLSHLTFIIYLWAT